MARMIGTLNGAMTLTTPAGIRRTIDILGSSDGSREPIERPGSPAAS
jgi:hypothetical protein